MAESGGAGNERKAAAFHHSFLQNIAIIDAYVRSIPFKSSSNTDWMKQLMHSFVLFTSVSCSSTVTRYALCLAVVAAMTTSTSMATN